ncbi:MAG TPA: hypothetical protein PKV72_01070 [Candidatus Peribacteria bacterium]|nr:hypothetical protein [Candidatus Peribacteria bacterium]
MSLSFQQRRDAIHEGMLRGDVGCGFGARAARQNAVAYCPAPEFDDVASMEGYGKALAGLGMSQNTVLMAVPAEDPASFHEGREYAFRLYEATIRALSLANRSMIRQLLQFPMPQDAAEQLVQFDREQAMRRAYGPPWLVQPQNRELMDNMFMIDGPAALSVLHVHTGALRKLMAFVMAPYYEPINDKPHPRHSPHFAFVLNYTTDVSEVMEHEQRASAAAREWLVSAVGYRYRQGFHIPQIPVPYDTGKD